MNDSRPESAYHVTVVIPTKNAGPEFRETLQAIFDQEGIARLEVIVVDSTSTDDTVAIARDFPVTVHTIEPGEFDHGHTRNLGASLAHGDFLVFLTQDALPANERWLASLVGTVAEDDRAAGGYSRVLPREGASFHAREGVMRDLNARDEPIRQGPCTPAELASASPFERRLLFNFNNVASCMRREAWIRMPFARLRWGEDLMWGRTAIEAGHAIRFVHDSVVLHSHEYDWRTLLSRTRIDGEMNKVLLDRDCVAGPLDALRLAARSTLEDWRVLGRESTPTGRRIILTLRSAGLHGVSMYGLWRGGAAGRHAPGTTRAVENRRLRILFVVHGYPPATLAGTEIYTRNLVRELSKEHEVVVFHRIENPDASNYSLEEGVHEGIRTLRLVNNLRYEGIDQTVVNPHVEEKFDWVLDDVRPDVVHFQHCLHLSVSLVGRTRERGIPAVVTLHDYWFVCPKVQLIKPDRSVCRTRRPGLVCIDCSERASWKVRVARILRRLAPPLASAFVAAYGRLMAGRPRFRRRMLLDAVALRDRLPNVRRQLDRASVLVSPSAFLKKKYVEYGFDPDRILFSRNGLAGAEALARVTKTGSDRIRFAFAGSLLWYKGVETLLRAFHDIDPERAELRIHGDHERHPLARAHFEELRPWVGSPAVRFCGAYANEDLPRIYAETDVLVVPSIWYENSPLTIQEAMAARTPVLASDLGAMKDLVRDGVNGRLFAPGNAADLATKVREILDDPAVIERWRAGITPVKTIEQNVGEMVVLYRQAMMQTEGPGAREHRPARPLLERPAGDYDRAEGAVREQGSGLVLLGPHEGESPSSVLYEFETNGDSSRRSTFELEIETQLLEGERRVVLGGTVLLNGSTVGSIPLHRWERGEPLVRSHRFGCSLEAGTNRLELVNRPGEVSGRCHLRLRRILLRSVPDRGGTEEARIGSAEHAIGERPSDEVEAGR